MALKIEFTRLCGFLQVYLVLRFFTIENIEELWIKIMDVRIYVCSVSIVSPTG